MFQQETDNFDVSPVRRFTKDGVGDVCAVLQKHFEDVWVVVPTGEVHGCTVVSLVRMDGVDIGAILQQVPDGVWEVEFGSLTEWCVVVVVDVRAGFGEEGEHGGWCSCSETYVDDVGHVVPGAGVELEEFEFDAVEFEAEFVAFGEEGGHVSGGGEEVQESFFR